jgi:RNA polymerase sigma factor (sigma-70 family)
MTAAATTLRLRRAARGDAAAFAAVYERHHQALYRYCRSILRHEEDAQDALQSTMTKAFAALQEQGRDFDLKPWLFRIAHNEAVSILRRRRETSELGDIPDLAPMEDLVMEREELRALRMDLADLPDRQRAALVLRELNGLSHAEIGKVLDLTATAVKHTIFEARSALFMCREGREMRCHDVRRMLSDGDGRVLRGRGVRAHLRTCAECRAFREDLTRRPLALQLLAPPLPTAAAASLLAQIAGTGTAAKVLCCVALAGGGATLAVEVQQAREAPKAAAQEAAPAPKRVRSTAPRVAPAPTVVVTRSRPQPAPVRATAGTPAAEPKRHANPKHKRNGRAERAHAQPAPEHDAPAQRAKPIPPGQANVPKVPPGQAKKQAKAPKVPPGQAKKQAKAPKIPPGQAKAPKAAKTPKPPKPTPPPQAANPAKPVPPGQAKQETKPEPPGQAKKHAAG